MKEFEKDLRETVKTKPDAQDLYQPTGCIVLNELQIVTTPPFTTSGENYRLETVQDQVALHDRQWRNMHDQYA